MVITKSEQAVLRVERYLHPYPMVQRKMETLWLKSQGVDDKTILLFVRNYSYHVVDIAPAKSKNTILRAITDVTKWLH